MLALFHKELPRKEGITEEKSCSDYIFATLGILLLSSFIQGFILVPFVSNQGSMEEMIHDPIVNLLNLFLTIITILLVLVISKKEYHRTWDSLGLSKKNLLSHYFLGHLLGFLMLSGALLIVLCFGGARFVGIEMVHPLLIGCYFIAFLFQGFEEELLCRGFMMYGLGQSKSVFFSVMTNSIFFAMLHVGNPGMSVLSWVNLILAGLVFSLLAVAFDDIWVASGAHSMWNFAQGNIYGILVSGIPMGPTIFRFELTHPLAGGTFGLEGGIGVFFVELVTIFMICFYYQRKTNNN